MTTKRLNKTIQAGLHFTKMSGAGNDFIIFDARESFPDFDRVLMSQALCRRSQSIGADGVIFIEKSTSAVESIKWDFYNADGSNAEFCGNAARCVARFAFESEITGKDLNIETIAGLVKATVLTDGQVQVEMPTPKIIEKNLVVPVGEHIKIEVLYLNTGVPHVVKETDDWEQEYLFEMGNYLRHHDLFKNTNGANATFFEITGPSKIQSATYERGVESVTMACGTGVVAAAIAATLKNVKSPIEIDVPGGRLVVSIGDELSSAMLTGDARFICEGEIFPEALL